MYEQQDNYELYKEHKEKKMTRIKQNLADVKATDEKRQSTLMQKVSNDNQNVEQFKVQQETNKNLKQELNRLKEMDLKELKAQQKRLNERKLAQMLQKRMRADETQKDNMKTRE